MHWQEKLLNRELKQRAIQHGICEWLLFHKSLSVTLNLAVSGSKQYDSRVNDSQLRKPVSPHEPVPLPTMGLPGRKWAGKPLPCLWGSRARSAAQTPNSQPVGKEFWKKACCVLLAQQNLLPWTASSSSPQPRSLKNRVETTVLTDSYSKFVL